MDKRLFINIGLLAFIALLLILILNSNEETKQEAEKLSSIDQSEIVKIRVARKNLDNFIFDKNNEAWLMISPLKIRANNARINAMLRLLKAESHSQLKPTDVELEALGLDEPAVILRLNNHEFKFGNTDAIDQRRYVLFKETIHLTNDFLYNQLMTNAAFFATPQLLVEGAKIKSIEYTDNKIELIDGHWQLQTLMDISPDQLKRIVFNWKNASALKVEPYNAPENESFITITTNNQTIKFVIVSTEPHLILGRKDIGIQYSMASEETEKLLLNESSTKEIESVDLELH